MLWLISGLQARVAIYFLFEKEFSSFTFTCFPLVAAPVSTTPFAKIAWLSFWVASLTFLCTAFLFACMINPDLLWTSDPLSILKLRFTSFFGVRLGNSLCPLGLLGAFCTTLLHRTWCRKGCSVFLDIPWSILAIRTLWEAEIMMDSRELAEWSTFASIWC